MRLRWVVALTILHAVIAAAAMSPAFFYLNVGTAQRVFGGSNGEVALLEDVRAYHDYASRTLNGSVPYRDFLVEYPIGAIPFFVLPRLIARSFDVYRWAFAAEMIVVDGWIVWMMAGHVREPSQRRRALMWYTSMLALLGALPIARFDLVSTALAFGAALSWSRGRSGLAGIVAGLGALVKLYPAIVVLPALVGPARQRNRGIAALIFTLGIGGSLWLAIGHSGVLQAMRYHAGRGLEIESIYAGFLIIAARLTGWPLWHDFNHSSVELISPWARTLAASSILFQVAGLGLAVATFKRRQAKDFVRYAGACIVVFATFGKVLSPQYMLWVLPFVVILEGRTGQLARPILAACCLLSSLVYFWAGVGLLSFHPLAMAILVIRNLGLLALLGVMLFVPDDLRS